MARVVVLGGGFGGLAAATTLRERLDGDDEVVLVAQDHRFAMGWTKIWDLVGIRPLEEGIRELGVLRERGIRFVHGAIDQIDPDERGVSTTEGDIEADAMIVALGAIGTPSNTEQLDGAVAHDLYSFSALPAAKAALASVADGRVVIAVMGQPFKCPPAPFEAALAIDEYLRGRGVRDAVEITMATPSPGALPVAGPAASALVEKQLTDRGIDLRLEHLATAIDPAARTVTFDIGTTLDANLIFGVPGAAPPPVVANSALAGDGGWIYPDPSTLAAGFAHVYAVGDCTTVPTATAALPKAGVFAAAQGKVAAANVVADLTQGPREEFDGRGHCYLELPGRKVAVVEGSFFAQPKPEVRLVEPTSEAFDDKVAFEKRCLNEWFGT